MTDRLMKSPMDWDFTTLGARARELAKPPFITGGSQPGTHCRYCPYDYDVTCSKPCANAYKDLYGFDPPAI